MEFQSFVMRPVFKNEMGEYVKIFKKSEIETLDNFIKNANHPNIIKCNREECSLIMEPGVNFETLVESRYKLQEVEKIKLIRDVSFALRHLHDRKILHRSIKPTNLFVVNKCGKLSEVYINNLKIQEKHCTPNLSSVVFYAPEIFTGVSFTMSADVYALGMCMWYLFKGKIPKDERYDDIPIIHYVKKIVDNDIMIESLESSIQCLFEKMTKFNPNERISIETVIFELNKILLEMESIISLGNKYTNLVVSKKENEKNENIIDDVEVFLN
jgi:serine/threonine protein kinase